MRLRDRLRRGARLARREILALWYASRHPGTPPAAKALALLLAAYAFSPIDLIPDFIPVLGHLDDLILLPLGVWLAVRLVPGPVMAECRRRAEARLAAGEGEPLSRYGWAIVLLAWAALAGFLWRAFG